MIENRPITTFISHLFLILGVLLVAFPIWITFVAASHDAVRMTQIPLPLLPLSFSHVFFLDDFHYSNASSRSKNIAYF